LIGGGASATAAARRPAEIGGAAFGVVSSCVRWPNLLVNDSNLPNLYVAAL